MYIGVYKFICNLLQLIKKRREVLLRINLIVLLFFILCFLGCNRQRANGNITREELVEIKDIAFCNDYNKETPEFKGNELLYKLYVSNSKTVSEIVESINITWCSQDRKVETIAKKINSNSFIVKIPRFILLDKNNGIFSFISSIEKILISEKKIKVDTMLLKKKKLNHLIRMDVVIFHVRDLVTMEDTAENIFENKKKEFKLNLNYPSIRNSVDICNSINLISNSNYEIYVAKTINPRLINVEIPKEINNRDDTLTL